MDLSDLTAFFDHSFCCYSSCLYFAADRSVNDRSDLFDNLFKITAFFCDQGWVCGNTTDNSHIICLADIIYICCVNKKLHEIVLLLHFASHRYRIATCFYPGIILYLYYIADHAHVKQISALLCHILWLYVQNNALKICISCIKTH